MRENGRGKGEIRDEREWLGEGEIRDEREWMGEGGIRNQREWMGEGRMKKRGERCPPGLIRTRPYAQPALCAACLIHTPRQTCFPLPASHGEAKRTTQKSIKVTVAVSTERM